MSRILAIDYGRKRTGIAVTDPMQIIANGLTTVSTHQLMDFLLNYIKQEPVERIIIGHPKQMNNEDSENMKNIIPFMNRLKKLLPDMPVELVDERFTSVLAHQAMLAGGLKKKDRQNKALVDEISATIILQSYLESKNINKAYRTMILPIYVYGQPVLREEAKDITPDYPELKELIQNMFETMDRADGVGLAAPQIGLAIRVVVVNLDVLSDDMPEFKGFRRAYINPHILEVGENLVSMEEGCLSLPGIHESVKRPDKIHVTYLDEEMNPHDEWVEGYLARVMQHEFDHLDGTMFIDHLSGLRKQMIRGKLNNMLKGKARCSYKVKTVK